MTTAILIDLMMTIPFLMVVVVITYVMRKGG